MRFVRKKAQWGRLTRRTFLLRLLPLRRVEEVQVENHGMSLYAVIEPVVDITSVKDVIVITEFEGQTVEETPAEDASEKAEDDR